MSFCLVELRFHESYTQTSRILSLWLLTHRRRCLWLYSCYKLISLSKQTTKAVCSHFIRCRFLFLLSNLKHALAVRSMDRMFIRLSISNAQCEYWCSAPKHELFSCDSGGKHGTNDQTIIICLKCTCHKVLNDRQLDITSSQYNNHNRMREIISKYFVNDFALGSIAKTKELTRTDQNIEK